MIVFILILFAVAGICKAVSDAIAHGDFRYKSEWWNNEESWRLKYKGGEKINGSAFIGSTTWLVFLTDAWHFFNFLTWLCVDASLLLIGWDIYAWWMFLPIAVRRISFEPVYRYLRKS